MIDLDHLEKLHAEATQGEWEYDPQLGTVHGSYRIIVCEVDDTAGADAAYIAATHNALPALIAEVRLARAELHERNHYQHKAEVEFAERKRIAEASDRTIIAATEKTLEHLEARMRAETQRDEAMAIADRWKSQAELRKRDEEMSERARKAHEAENRLQRAERASVWLTWRASPHALNAARECRATALEILALVEPEASAEHVERIRVVRERIAAFDSAVGAE